MIKIGPLRRIVRDAYDVWWHKPTTVYGQWRRDPEGMMLFSLSYWVHNEDPYALIAFFETLIKWRHQ